MNLLVLSSNRLALPLFQGFIYLFGCFVGFAFRIDCNLCLAFTGGSNFGTLFPCLLRIKLVEVEFTFPMVYLHVGIERLVLPVFQHFFDVNSFIFPQVFLLFGCKFHAQKFLWNSDIVWFVFMGLLLFVLLKVAVLV